ncbi:MAG: hypothetical protein B7Y86_09375 [Brevundimonas subvibrioides]|uniref:DUF4279 domain-containing protein n=1 Tax=Brevundimonas subvibrioides TaxID=74313 RepID=A0A258HJ72_9CAUL|nr:DUF4279 domain-containing protein [Brevundimonas subvibrioides]OYX56946.1 MAG: hypothetical protein B7Y86_09375 [Brevundimonas subvibrioides]
MAGIGRTVLTLRFFGEDLHPAELTRLLGSEPTKSELKGDVRPSGHVAKAGSWRLSVEDRAPGDLECQIRNLFAGLTADVGTWTALSSRYRGDLFCGLFMQQGNEGLDLEPETLAMIGNRGLRLAVDIYDPGDDEP